MMHILLNNGLKCGLLFILLFGLGVNSTQAQFHYEIPLTTQVKPDDLIIGGDAMLTSGGADLQGQGWLRLTPDEKNKKGWAYINKSFSSKLGLLVEFEYKIWTNGPIGKHGSLGLADGLSVFLFDGNTQEADFKPGADGGSLVYAGNNAVGGLTNGYLGIGLDTYGSFSTSEYARSGVNKKEGGPGARPNSIALRGGAAENYPYLSGTEQGLARAVDQTYLKGKTIGYTINTPARPGDDKFFRKVRFYLLPTAEGKGFETTVQLKLGNNAQDPFYTVIEKQRMNVTPPPTLKIGFGASTGGGYAHHEVRNLNITAPVDISVKTTVDKPSVRVGNHVTYETVVSNSGINSLSDSNKVILSIETNDGVSIPDDIMIGVIKSDQKISIVKDKANSGSGRQVYIISNFPAGASLTLKYQGTINRSISFKAMNKATITLSDGLVDIDSSNDESHVTTDIIREVDLVLDNIMEINGVVYPIIVPQPVGTQLNYTTVISNRGPDDIIHTDFATFSLETVGANINPDNVIAAVQRNQAAIDGNLLITYSKGESTTDKHVYHIANFPKDASIVLKYFGTILQPMHNGSDFAENQASITPPAAGFYELNDKDNTMTAKVPIIKDVNMKVANVVDPLAARSGSLVKYITELSNLSAFDVKDVHVVLETDGVSLLNSEMLDRLTIDGVELVKNNDKSKLVKWVYAIASFPAGAKVTWTYQGRITSKDKPATNLVRLDVSDEKYRELQKQNNQSIAETKILRDIDLQVVNKAEETTPQAMGAVLNYTTEITNLGPSEVMDAVLSIEVQGVDIIPEKVIANVAKNDAAKDVTIQLFTTVPAPKVDPASTATPTTSLLDPVKYSYSIPSLPANGTITLKYTGKINSKNHSAINIVRIASPENVFYDTDPQNNVSAVQTWIKPTLVQPLSATICPGESIMRTLESDMPADFVSYEWTMDPSSDAISVYPLTPTTGTLIQGTIKNKESNGGLVVYAISPIIKAPIISTDGVIQTTFNMVSGDSKPFTVTIKSLALTPSVSVTQDGVIDYKEDVVLTPKTRLKVPSYNWYRTVDKKDPITEGVDYDGVLTQSNLLPGTYIYYVTASNADFCEGETTKVTFTVNSISVKGIPTVFTPNNDGVNDLWLIPDIEQYPNCTVRIFNRSNHDVYYSLKGYKEPWNGRYMNYGDPLPNRTSYQYIIELNDGTNKAIGGVVSIIRGEE